MMGTQKQEFMAFSLRKMPINLLHLSYTCRENALVPGEGAAVLVLDDTGLEEVLFLFEVHGFGHPGEGVVGGGEDGVESELGAAAVGDEVHVLLAECGAEAEEAVGHGVAAVGGFELGCGAEHGADLVLEGLAPEARVLDLDLVDDVDAEVEVDGFVAEDVLVLLGDADHLVAASEREDLREARVEPHAFEDDVEGDEVAEEGLVGCVGAGGEGGIAEALCVLDGPGGFLGDGRDLAIHVEELAFVEAEGLDDVLEGVGVDGLFKGLAKQVLAALGVGEMAIDGEDDVVGDERL
jgi:hypothetical protein